MGMKMRMNIILKDSQIVVGWSVFIFIPLLILILNRLLAFARDRLLGVASEKTKARLRLAFFVSLFPLFQTSFESLSFQNKNAPFGALFFLAESEGFEPPDLLQSTVFKTAAIDHSANSPRQR